MRHANLLVALVLIFSAAWAKAQDANIIDFKPTLKLGGAPKATSDLGGYFSAVIPQQYFACQFSPQLITCVGVLAVSARLTIKMEDSPSQKPLSQGDLGLLGLNRLDEYKKKSQFRLIKTGQTSVDGNPAIVQTFGYNNLANVQLPVWVQILSASQGAKLFTLQVECTSSFCAEYAPAIDQIFSTFHIAKLDKNGQPMKIDTGPKPSDTSGNTTLDQIVNELDR